MCEHYDYLGSRRDGGFAEYVAVPDWNLMELPENVSFREAAMLEPLSVALHAVKRSGVKPGDTAAVIGTGMIGFAAAAWAKALGAETVFVIGRGEAKRAIAEQIPGISYVTEEESKAIQADVVVEAAGRFRCSSSCKTGRKHRADGKSIGRSCDGKERVLAHPAQTAEPDGNVEFFL